MHQASSIHDIETKFIQAIRRKDIAEVKQLCEKLLNARSIDHYDVAVYLEIAREEIEKITNKPTRTKLLAIINTCDRQNLIAHASARRI